MHIGKILIGAGAALALAAVTACRSNDERNNRTAARQNQSGTDRSSSSASATGAPESYATPLTAASTPGETSVENQAGHETGATATSGMQTYRVSKVSGSTVTLEPTGGAAAQGGGSAAGSSERQNQSGKELELSVSEFQLLSGQGSSAGSATSAVTPHVGDIFLVSMGPSNTPTHLQPVTAVQTGSKAGGSGTTP